MNILIPYIWAAGGVHLLLVIGSVFLPSKLKYRASLSNASPIVRQIFLVHHVFIALVLLGFSGLCFFFAPELSSANPLGKFLSGFIAIFWLLRIVVQTCYYDPDVKKQYPLANVAYTLIFVYLASVFSLATLGIVK